MNVVHQIFTATTLAVILIKVAPLLLSAIGGAITQQGNILNIGLEGMMLIGAFTAVAIGSKTHFHVSKPLGWRTNTSTGRRPR